MSARLENGGDHYGLTRPDEIHEAEAGCPEKDYRVLLNFYLASTSRFLPGQTTNNAHYLILATWLHVVYALANDAQRVEDVPLRVCSPTQATPQSQSAAFVIHHRSALPTNLLALVAQVDQLIPQNASLHELWGTTPRSQGCSSLSSPRYRATEERANHCLLLSVNLLLPSRPLASPGPCKITRPTGRPSQPSLPSHVLPNGIWFTSIIQASTTPHRSE